MLKFLKKNKRGTYKENLLNLKSARIMLFFAVLVLFSSTVSADPINDTFHINLQTTFSNGTIQNGTFNFAFNITNNSDQTCLGNVVYNYSATLATDSRGVASIYLPTIGNGGGNLSNLGYDIQYYLCYYRDGVLQNVDQLGRVPYSFRATEINLSEVKVNTNLSLGNFNISANTGLFSFLGTFVNRITSLFVGNINASGNISTEGNVSADWLFGKLNASDIQNAPWVNASNAEPLWNGNYSNFTTIYGYATNGTYYLATNPNGYITWTNATNGTLMLASNWNATNTSYYLATNPFGFYNSSQQNINLNLSSYLNLTNQTGSLFFINASTGSIGIGTKTPQNTLNVLGSFNATGAAIFPNSICSPGQVLSTTASGQLTCVTDQTGAGGTITGVGTYGYLPMWNGSTSMNDSALYQNGTFIGIGTTSPQNALNVIGDINATTSIFAQNTKNLSIGYDYATNGTYYLANNPNSYITWVQATNGTLGLNTTFSLYYPLYNPYGYYNQSNFNISDYLLKVNWNATNTSYYLVSNPFGYYNQSNFNITDYLLKTQWNATNTSYYLATNPNGYYNSTTLQNVSQLANDRGFITWTNATNGTLMSQATFNTNYTTNDAIYRSFANNYSNFSNIYGYAINGSGWPANYTNFLVGYNYSTNGTYYLATNPFGFYNSTNPPPSSEPLWNANYSNFLTSYNYSTNGTYYLATNPAGYITWTNATNGTLMSQAAWNTNYTANNDAWLNTTNLTYHAGYLYATNGTYYLATNPNGYYNSTNPPPANETNWNGNYSNFTNVYGYATNGTYVQTSNVGNLNVNSSNYSNYSTYLGGHPASFFMPLNTSVSGNFDFNGGWTSGGVSLIGGDLYAHTIFVYNISSLQVSNLNVNGSFIPSINNSFDLGNGTLMWRDLYLSGSAHVVGTVYSNGLPVLTSYTETDPLWTANYSNFTNVYGYATNGTYYLATNPNGYITWTNATNGTLMLAANWNATNTSYYLATNPNGYYNSTTLQNVSQLANDRGFITWTNATNGTLMSQATFNTNYTTNDAIYRSFANNYSNFSNIYGYAINGSGWPANYSNFLVGYNYSTNGTYYLATNPNGYYNSTGHSTWDINITNGYLNVTNQTTSGLLFVNGTSGNVGIGTTNPQSQLQISGSGNQYLTIDSTNSFSPELVFNQGGITQWKTMVGLGNNYILYDANSNARFFINQSTGYTGINTTTPQNTLNVNGDINSTGTVFAQNTKNLSIGYDYATNNTYLTQANWNTNYTANNDAWLNTTNLTYNGYNATGLIQNWNSTGYIQNWNASGYLINWSIANSNETNWNANYTNFLVGYNYSTNGTYFTQANWNTNYTANNDAWLNTTNLTYDTGTKYATNGTYYLATNPNGYYNSTNPPPANETNWNANYSVSGPYINWSTAYNGTLAKTDASNAFGAFNQSFDTNTLFINANDNRIGINTGTPMTTVDIEGIAFNSTDGLHLQSVDNHWLRVFPSLGNLNYNPIVQGGDQGIIFSGGSGNATGFVIAPWSNNIGGLRIFSNGNVGINATNPQNALNVNGDINSTTSVFAQATKNLSIGYDYATNTTYLTQASWNTNYTTNLAAWLNTTNLTYHTGYLYATNGTYNTNATSPFTANYSNFSNIYGYALNGSGWVNNYSNFLLSYNYSTNGTFLTSSNISGMVNGSGTYGYIPMWNGTTSINNSAIYQNGSNVGIGTTNPNATFNLIGTLNATSNGGTLLVDSNGNVKIGL